MISYHEIDIKTTILSKRKTSKWIKQIASRYDKIIGNINFIFCTDEKIIELNQKYLKHNYYTDIITFDYSENNIIAGDIFISMDTVHSNAEKFNEPFIREIYRVMIHGILHLCGIQDKSASQRLAMRESENEALNFFFQ